MTNLRLKMMIFCCQVIERAADAPTSSSLKNRDTPGGADKNTKTTGKKPFR